MYLELHFLKRNQSSNQDTTKLREVSLPRNNSYYCCSIIMILCRRRYDSNKFVEYNIKCEDGEIAYMEIEDFMLNAATCSSTGSRYVYLVNIKL